jgi:hypothetical protein
MTNVRVKANSPGKMVESMTVNGKMVNSMEEENS